MEYYIFIADFKDPKRKGRVNEKEVDSENIVQIILPIASIIDNRYQVNEQGIIEEIHPYCKHCHSSNFVRKCFNWRTICLEKGILIRVKVKRYYTIKKSFQIFMKNITISLRILKK